MKKLIFLILAVFITAPALYSQKTLIGTVEYSYKLVGEGAESMAGMMPEKMIFKYGKNGLAMEMKGGMMASAMGRTVVNGETGEAFIIKDSEKAVYLMSQEEIKEQAEKVSTPVIQKFDDEKTILGYKCKKYTQTTDVQGVSMTQTLWVTDELFPPEYQGDAFKGMAAQGGMSFDLKGFPMLIEIDMPGMPMKVKLEVTNIDFGKIDNSTFKKPAGYTVKSFSEMNAF